MTESLETRLVHLRSVLKGHWQSWAEEKGWPFVANGATMCRFTAAFLSDVLGWEWRAAGGDPTYKGDKAGFFDGETWHGHFWVTNGRQIIDLTANQFGAEEIVLTTVDDSRYRANYTQMELDNALYEVEDRVDEWLGAYYAAHPVEPA
jgi:hypothetical protein